MLERDSRSGMRPLGRYVASNQWCAMSNVIQFRSREAAIHDDLNIDLLTAVDVAIRDLRDISRSCDAPTREQAQECQRMLERVLHEALRED